MKVSVLLGAFFVNEARNNNNTFKMEDKNNYYFIDNYGNTTNYYKYDSNSEVLYFAKNDTKEEPKKKTNDYLFYYIGAGILGVIILGLIIYLIFREPQDIKNRELVNLVDEIE